MNLCNAPDSGIMYALYTDRVEYRPYKKEELSEDAIQKQLLELHLFDNTTEYRMIQSERGEIENVISDENMPHDDIYCEKIYTLKENEDQSKEQDYCIEVVNYLTYDENDLLLIRNYRLKEVRKQ